MKNMFSLATVALVLALSMFAGSESFAAQQDASAQGYDIRLNGDKIELEFPDGSVLRTPRNADLKTLEGVTATGGGMAQQLLDQAHTELGLNPSSELPKVYGLAQNYPNPFNPSTTITYSIPEDASRVRVEMSVYNMRGQLVRTLVNETKEPGQYSVNWDGADHSGTRVSSGVYFYRINAGDYHATRKMVILK